MMMMTMMTTLKNKHYPVTCINIQLHLLDFTKRERERSFVCHVVCCHCSTSTITHWRRQLLKCRYYVQMIRLLANVCCKRVPFDWLESMDQANSAICPELLSVIASVFSLLFKSLSDSEMWMWIWYNLHLIYVQKCSCHGNSVHLHLVVLPP